MNVQSVAIGSDHAGYSYKQAIINTLEGLGIKVHNYGTDSPASVDYPDFIHPVAHDVATQKVDLGIVLCGSGNGAAMTANKHQAVRAALCWSVELAVLARQHNDANVLAIPVRFITQETALEMVRTFVKTPFEGGRHARRVGKISLK